MEKIDTIAAIATGLTNSGISVIRISGEEAISIADSVIQLKSGKKIRECDSHTIQYGHVYDDNHKIDEVLVLIMRGPRSFTSEDTIEIDCHGGVYVTKKVLETVIKHGARPAEPGEFTKRAFLNGRIDLAQAESVIDVINSKNDYALNASMSQLSGSFSKFIENIRKEIIHEIAFIESAIDDPEHYSLDGYAEKLKNKIYSFQDQITDIMEKADDGKVLVEGINTVIVGKPNSGKSSLMNRLVGRERAIVTDIAGTTRDVIEEVIQLHGLTLNVIDTAGIRDTEDVVEKIGVDKAKEYLEYADLVIYVVDASVPLDESDYEIMERIQKKNVIVLLNKSDLDTMIQEEDISSRLEKKVITISAKENEGIDVLEKEIQAMFLKGNISMNDEIIITNIRHKNLLMRALESFQLVISGIEEDMPEDFYTIDLMNAYESLGSILGVAMEDDLANEIFSKFCMGK